MAKRIVLGILGAIAAFGSLLPLGYAFEIFKDFKNPEISFWPNVLGELLMCSIALVGLWIGIRFLRFADPAELRKVTVWQDRYCSESGLSFRRSYSHSRSPYYG